MTLVWWDAAGLAVDWDWQRSLTVWTVRGPRFPSRFDGRILEHELAARPVSERHARAAAGRWWRVRGRSEALERAAELGHPPGRAEAPGHAREQG